LRNVIAYCLLAMLTLSNAL